MYRGTGLYRFLKHQPAPEFGEESGWFGQATR